MNERRQQLFDMARSVVDGATLTPEQQRDLAFGMIAAISRLEDAEVELRFIYRDQPIAASVMRNKPVMF